MNKQNDTVETAGGVKNNSGLSPTNNVFNNIISNPSENTTDFSEKHQDRFDNEFFELFARDSTVEKESKVLGDDLVRLADVIRMTGKKIYSDKLVSKVALKTRNKSNPR